MTTSSESDSTFDRVAYWLVGGTLVACVAMLTGQRENNAFADAWEHHRVILALQENLFNPSNPTFASTLPSVRFSPYFIVQALVCRSLGVDAYDVLSWAAVLNTLLLVLAIRAFLRSFGEGRSSAAALLVMVSLYGGAPRWAGTYALSDLPWHQVNPSAFSLPLVIFAWALFRRFNERGWRDFAFPLMVVLLAEAMLDHGMTGVFGFLGLLVMSAAFTTTSRVRLIAGVVIATGLVGVFCLMWPWYPFLTAVLSRPDPAFWFSRQTLISSLFVWPAPAIVCALAALALRRREFVRVCLLGAAVCFALGLVSLPMQSPLLARLPMPGLLFVHLPVALFVHDAGILRLKTWFGRRRDLLSMESHQQARAALETAVALCLVYFLVPQLADLAREPYLGRKYFAALAGKEDGLVILKQRFDALLKPVGVHDVVLSDRITSWPIPSARGRIVAALHYEYFVPDQATRDRDVDQFFGEASEVQREALLQRYSVKWIVLDSARLDRYQFANLFEPSAEVARDGNLHLMEVKAWLRARQGRPD